MLHSDLRKKVYVKFIENQLEKPAVVVRLTNQLQKVVRPITTKKERGTYLKTVSPPFDTFMKAKKAKALYSGKSTRYSFAMSSIHSR